MWEKVYCGWVGGCIVCVCVRVSVCVSVSVCVCVCVCVSVLSADLRRAFSVISLTTNLLESSAIIQSQDPAHEAARYLHWRELIYLCSEVFVFGIDADTRAPTQTHTHTGCARVECTFSASRYIEAL